MPSAQCKGNQADAAGCSAEPGNSSGSNTATAASADNTRRSRNCG